MDRNCRAFLHWQIAAARWLHDLQVPEAIGCISNRCRRLRR